MTAASDEGVRSRRRMRRPLLKGAMGLLIVAIVTGAGIAWQRRVRAGPPTFLDLSYAPTSPAQRLDLYLPPGRGPFPLIVYVHGGAFRYGSKREGGAGFADAIETARARRIAFASVEYRLSDEATFPAAVRDVKSAVRYLRANAARLRINPDRIALWGKSAGANLVLVAGMSDGVALFDDPDAPHGQTSASVLGIVSMYAPTDFARMDAQLRPPPCEQEEASHARADSAESRYLGAALPMVPERVAASNPLTYARPNSPPMLLQAGTDDCVVPWRQSVILDRAVTRAAGPGRSTFELFAGAEHADAAFDTPANLARVTSFLEQALTPRRSIIRRKL